MDNLALYQPYLNIGIAVDTSRSFKNSAPVNENTQNYGYNDDLTSLNSIMDEAVYSYINEKFDGFKGMNAWRLEDFQDGSFLLEFDKDKDYKNHKTNYGLGMDFSYEAAIHFFRNENGNIEAISIFDEGDIQAWQNLKNYEKETLIFGEYGILQEDIEDANVKVIDSKKGILEIKEEVDLNKISNLLNKKTLTIEEKNEYNKDPVYLSDKDEQAKMFVHLANPLFEETDEREISGLLNDIFTIQKEMEEDIY